MPQPITVSGSMTRLTGTTQYTSGDVIGQSGTAGSCSPITLNVAPEGGDRFGVAWREFPGGVSGQTVTADPTSDAVECMALAAWR